MEKDDKRKKGFEGEVRCRYWRVVCLRLCGDAMRGVWSGEVS